MNGTNYDEARNIIAFVLGKPDYDMTLKDWNVAYERITEEFYNDIQTKDPVLVEEKYGYLTEDIGAVIESIRGKDNEQYQRRDTLTNRKVLQMEATEVDTKYFSAAEKDALQQSLSCCNTFCLLPASSFFIPYPFAS